MMGVAVIVGAALVSKEMLSDQLGNLVLGFTTGFLMTGAAMAINDYYDREIDAINEPLRPVPSGEIRPSEALIFSALLAIFGLAGSLLTSPAPNWLCLIVASVSLIFVILYVTIGKSTGLPGNMLVSICIVVPFLYGGLVIGRSVLPATSIVVVIVFIFNTSREITKGIVDVQGDRKNNVKTLAVRYGEQNAAILAALLNVSAVLLTPLPWLMGIVNFWFIPFAVLADVGLLSTAALLALNPSRENARKTKNRNLIWFLLGLLAFILGAN
jgi:geranylgeranylglycerol-phosphate geranylgeranyltransferase